MTVEAQLFILHLLGLFRNQYHVKSWITHDYVAYLGSSC